MRPFPLILHETISPYTTPDHFRTLHLIISPDTVWNHFLFTLYLTISSDTTPGHFLWYCRRPFPLTLHEIISPDTVQDYFLLPLHLTIFSIKYTRPFFPLMLQQFMFSWHYFGFFSLACDIHLSIRLDQSILPQILTMPVCQITSHENKQLDILNLSEADLYKPTLRQKRQMSSDEIHNICQDLVKYKVCIDGLRFGSDYSSCHLSTSRPLLRHTYNHSIVTQSFCLLSCQVVLLHNIQFCLWLNGSKTIGYRSCNCVPLKYAN